jgi:tryptophan synthase alpha chain
VTPASGRIARRFAALRAEGRGGLITFTTAGDPEPEIAAQLLAGLPAAGADLIELGIPFSDPMADGPAIQAASLRALKAGMTLRRTLSLVKQFRERDRETPLILMGYFNPIFRYGCANFARDARDCGVDGLIVIDLPPEEDAELRGFTRALGLDLIRLATPTSDDARLPRLLEDASGFLYYVSIAGITGTRVAPEVEVQRAVERIRRHTSLPIAVGFGIRTPELAAAIARVADAAVVGTAVVQIVAGHLDEKGVARPGLVESVHSLVRELAKGVRGARRSAA